jgi:hypothetical protein
MDFLDRAGPGCRGEPRRAALPPATDLVHSEPRVPVHCAGDPGRAGLAEARAGVGVATNLGGRSGAVISHLDAFVAGPYFGSPI